ncbi:hypothetical protein [Paludibacterium yongneupense]|uniref:hypothetical protein n=1 Tax=Paludibacterium yongneupense TaxID=400061 RepID=UPI00048CDFFD|nr:hypothetical protein [Paludibacterium yongneupense]
MTHDPILRVCSIWGRRYLIFILATTMLSATTWGWCLLEMNVDLSNWFSVLTCSFDFSAHPVQALLFRGCIAIGFLLTTVIYLAIALWWRGQAQVHYQRGGRFIDHRGEGQK